MEENTDAYDLREGYSYCSRYVLNEGNIAEQKEYFQLKGIYILLSGYWRWGRGKQNGSPFQ